MSPGPKTIRPQAKRDVVLICHRSGSRPLRQRCPVAARCSPRAWGRSTTTRRQVLRPVRPTDEDGDSSRAQQSRQTDAPPVVAAACNPLEATERVAWLCPVLEGAKPPTKDLPSEARLNSDSAVRSHSYGAADQLPRAGPTSHGSQLD